ncbi:hypothetical protein P153DRAFT_368731 [Dothidotthia symphoricarpi CBS 119687]|uniref:Stress-response A/B barrel domain-containing protein n=1 Tax=Dothidotthia symphoricarpi CBS 119687 TaxID=1392245 RepID=A0A6A6A6D0_9PLEO|nr:uncharacterized protein P153DRAFT_368731 [Dothidotthia symphoricarpi CBS 119687]KAF2127439.1 hypothetical protein P153DRAFT_368731 [Dothidotthia symphoricarpi CBS 119687]
MIVPRKAFGTLVLVLLLSCFVIFSQQWQGMLFGNPGPIVPYTTHIVLFQFKDGTSPIAIKEIASKFIALKRSCIHPSTQRPYIFSLSGGKDISIEKLQNGISHAFVLQFYSNADRDYYVNEDPVHQTFKEAAGAVVQQTLVVDYQDGVFTEAG